MSVVPTPITNRAVSATTALLPTHPRRLIALLGIAQIISWGSLYYGFSLFVMPMAHSLEWSLPLLNGALSSGLVLSALCAYPIGAYIDRHGGRGVMTVGSLAAAALLCVWSQVTSIAAFYLIWLGLGACMAAVLYEPVFVVLTRLFPTQARRAITALTLIAGFAGTVAIPLTESLLALLPWRQVLVILAAAHALICAPIHWWIIPIQSERASPAADPLTTVRSTRVHLRHCLADPLFWSTACWFTAFAGTAAGITLQLVPYLQALGVARGTLLSAIAVIGPAQVCGRLLLMGYGERIHLISHLWPS